MLVRWPAPKCNLRRCFHVPARFRLVLRGSFACVGPCSHVFFQAIWVFEPFSVVIVFHSSRSYYSDAAVVLCRLWCGCPTASIHSSEEHFYPFRTVFFGVAVGWRIDKFTDQSRPHELERKLLSTTGQRMSVRVPVKPRICLSVLWYLGSF